MDRYPEDVEQKMKQFADWLSERDRRRYAAIEALKLDHGGIVCCRSAWRTLGYHPGYRPRCACPRYAADQPLLHRPMHRPGPVG